MSPKKILPLTLIMLILCCVSAGCISETNYNESALFFQNAAWSDEVKTALNDFVTLYGNTSDIYDDNSYAVSDFDNTACIYDIERQALFYQLETMSFVQDPETFAASVKTGLYEECADLGDDIIDAYSTLYERYGPFSAEGLSDELQTTIKNDPYWKEFASKTLYLALGTDAHDENWMLYLLSGMTADDIYTLTYNSCDKYSKLDTHRVTISGPENISSRTGPKTYSFVNGLTIADATKELWKVLQENGIDVWVCSASEVNQVRAAIDLFGLYPYCTGIVAKTMKFDADGKLIPEYDYESGLGYLTGENGTWEKSAYYTNASCAKKGKVTAILNAIAPYYHNKTPIAGFMDSTGDFNFCTEFNSLKLVICFNRADRSITDGGGLISAVAVYQQMLPESTLQSVNAAGDTFYLLQGRDENDLRNLRPSNSTIIYGDTTEKLFKNEDNYKLLNYISNQSLSIADSLNTFALKTNADDPNNPLGVTYGFCTEYQGYHSI